MIVGIICSLKEKYYGGAGGDRRPAHFALRVGHSLLVFPRKYQAVGIYFGSKLSSIPEEEYYGGADGDRTREPQRCQRCALPVELLPHREII